MPRLLFLASSFYSRYGFWTKIFHPRRRVIAGASTSARIDLLSKVEEEM